MINRIGPRILPCGTPISISIDGDTSSPIQTDVVLPLRYDLNHSNAVSESLLRMSESSDSPEGTNSNGYEPKPK